MNDFSVIQMCLQTLAERCDGARAIDGAGFSKFDSGLGKQLADCVELTPKQAIAGQKLVIKYGGQLDPDYVDYVRNQIVEVEAEIETPKLPLFDVIAKLQWSAPKEVKNGELQLETAGEPSAEFWAIYKENKSELQNQGISVSKKFGKWVICRWKKLLEPAIEKLLTKVKLELESDIIPDYIKNKLHDYQIPSVLRLVQSLITNNAALDASDGGTGKTIVGLAVAATLGKKAIVCCPRSSIHSVWEYWAKEFGVEIYANNYEQYKTGNTQYGQWVTEIVTLNNGTDQTQTKFQWNIPDDSILIFDECHRCGNLETQNSQLLIGAAEASKNSAKVLCCSATTASTPLQMRALGYLLGLFELNKYWDWAKDHGVRRGRWGMEFSGSSIHLQNIHDQIFGQLKGSRVRKADVPGFPDSIISPELIDFGCNPKIAAAYDDMLDEIERLKDRCDADLGNCILTTILRARMKVELLKVPMIAEMAKDLIEDGNSVVIFLSFQDSIDSLAKKLGWQDSVIDGRNVKTRDSVVANFQKNHKRGIIANIKAGSESIGLHDLTGDFPRVVLLNPDFSANAIQQALLRTPRQGGKTVCIQKFLFADGTIENRARDRVKEKIKNISTLNDRDLGMGINI